MRVSTKISALCLAAIVLSLQSFGQCSGTALYSLDLADPTNHSMTCGTVSGSKWQVTKNSTCNLTTSTIMLPGDSTFDPMLDVPVSFRIHATGNCGAADTAWYQYNVNGGAYVTMQTFDATGISGVTYIYDTVFNVAPESDITIRVVYKTSGGCTNWKLWNTDGDGICVEYPFVAGSHGMTSFLSLLPIELSAFGAEVVGSLVEINWTTITEKNNDFFTLQRSENGATFSDLAFVKGAGNSTSELHYKEDDTNPLSGNNYYRLKQTDFDDKTETSEIIAVTFKNDEGGECEFKVYPNPCPGKCNVDLESCNYNEQDIRVNMIDAMGNVVQSNIPLNDLNKTFKIDTRNNLMPGIYVVTGATSDDQKFNKKIIVQ